MLKELMTKIINFFDIFSKKSEQNFNLGKISAKTQKCYSLEICEIRRFDQLFKL